MNLRRMVIFLISTFQRSIVALLQPFREVGGVIKAITPKIFTIEAHCFVSRRMNTQVRLISKYETF